MIKRLPSFLLVVLVLSAADSVGARWDFEHREPEPALALQTLALWGIYGLLALPLVGALGKLPGFRPKSTGVGGTSGDSEDESVRRARALDFPLRLFGVLAFAALAHGRLDRFTGLGGDVSALMAPRPWLEVAAVALGLLALGFLLRRALVRVAPPALAAVVLVAGCFGHLWVGWGGGSMSGARARAPLAGSERLPNILVVIWDTARAKSLSFQGAERETTPHLARFAEESMVYGNARSASVFTLSSHLSMLTGVYPSEHGVSLVNQSFDAEATPTVTGVLGRAGYRTGAFLGTDVLRHGTGMEEGFEVYDDTTDPPVTYTRGWAMLHDVQSVLAAKIPALRFNGLPHWIQDFQRPAPPVLDRALAWIENGDPRPWFCFVNLYDVHWPYLPADPFADEWVSDYDGPIDGYLFRSDRFPTNYQLNGKDKAHLTELYEAELAQLDAAVDDFLGRVDLDDPNLAVVITSDHGEAFGENGRYEHADVLECQVHVPLLIRRPGAPPTARGRNDLPVSGIDLAPTLLSLAGFRPEVGSGDPRLPEFRGVDLLTGLSDPGRAILVEDRDHMDPDDYAVALYEGPWKLVRRGLQEDEDYELFDIRIDQEDAFDESKYNPEALDRLRTRMLEIRAVWGANDADAARSGGQDNSAALQALGYVEGSDGSESDH